MSSPVHVLGYDPRATYLAHVMSGLPHSPPVRLLLSGQSMANWLEEGRQVRLLRAGALQPRGRVVGELLAEPTDEALLAAATAQRRTKTKSWHRHIENLVVTLPCSRSINAIRWLQHRIDHRTTICLLQSGLGVAERLNELFFTDAASRPRYVLGHMTHNLGYHDNNFTLVELAPGNMRLTVHDPEAAAAADRGDGDGDGDDNGDGGLQLVRRLGLTPTLGAGGYAMDDFLQWKLPDMVYTAAVEPVATMLDMAPDAVWQSSQARALVEGLMGEMVAVAAQLPETRASATLATFVNSGMLERQAQQRRQQRELQQKHKRYYLQQQQHQHQHQHQHQNQNQHQHQQQQQQQQQHDDMGVQYQPRAWPWSATTQAAIGESRMAKLVREGRVTDIQFLNGWFVRRGREVGIDCPQNEMMMRLVRAKQRMSRARLDSYVPLVESTDTTTTTTTTTTAARQRLGQAAAPRHVSAGWANPRQATQQTGEDGVERQSSGRSEDGLEDGLEDEAMRMGSAASMGGY